MSHRFHGFLFFSAFIFLPLAKDTLKTPKDTVKVKLKKYEIEREKRIFKIRGEKDISLDEILEKKIYTKGIAAGEFGGAKKERIALQKAEIEKKVHMTIPLLKELPEKFQKQIEKSAKEIEMEEDKELVEFKTEKPKPKEIPEVVEEPTVISPIILATQELSVKRAAIKTLGEIKEPSAIPVLKETVLKGSSAVRHEAAEALAKLGDTLGIETLKKELKAEELTVKIKAIKSLGEVKEPSSIPELRTLLSEKETPVSIEAAFALAKAGDKRGIDRVKKLLESKNEDVRLEAASVLASIKDRAAIPVLEASLKSSKSSVKAKAATALGDLGDKSFIPLLEKLMTKDSDFKVRLSASESILKLKGITE